MTRAKKQMIGVGQDDTGVELILEIPRRERLHSALCADRHEDGCLDGPVGGVKETGASAGLGTNGLYFETNSLHGSKSSFSRGGFAGPIWNMICLCGAGS